jgi:hypothetical protein
MRAGKNSRLFAESGGQKAEKNTRSRCLFAVCLLPGDGVMVFYFGDLRKWDLNYLAIRAFHFDAGCGQRLSSLHAFYNAAHALAVNHHDFNIVLAVEWLQSRERFSYFHVLLFPPNSNPAVGQTSYPRILHASVANVH